MEQSPNPGTELYSKGCRLWLGTAAPALAATCLPSGSSAWAFPTESEINKAVNNPLPVRRKDRRALDRDNGRCRATRGPANLVPQSGTETAERRVPDRKEQLNLQGPLCRESQARLLRRLLVLTVKDGGRTLPWPLTCLAPVWATPEASYLEPDPDSHSV